MMERYEIVIIVACLFGWPFLFYALFRNNINITLSDIILLRSINNLSGWQRLVFFFGYIAASAVTAKNIWQNAPIMDLSYIHNIFALYGSIILAIWPICFYILFAGRYGIPLKEYLWRPTFFSRLDYEGKKIFFIGYIIGFSFLFLGLAVAPSRP